MDLPFDHVIPLLGIYPKEPLLCFRYSILLLLHYSSFLAIFNCLFTSSVGGPNIGTEPPLAYSLSPRGPFWGCLCAVWYSAARADIRSSTQVI